MVSRVRVVCALAILLAAGSRSAWAQDELFVTNTGNDSVTVYSRTANGNVAPLRTLSGAATGLNAPTFLAVTTGAAPLPAATIPTLELRGLIALTLLLAAIGFFVIRRMLS